MKRLQHVSSVLCLLVLVSWAAAAEARHPNLLFNRQELAEIKSKIEKYPWARQTFERIKADAETDSTSPHHNVPTKVATALMYALTGEEQYARRALGILGAHAESSSSLANT